MTTVFLDTVGLLATWDESDQWHAAASAALDQFTQDGTALVTTTFVLVECGNAAARRPYCPAVNRLRLALEAAQALIDYHPRNGKKRGSHTSAATALARESSIKFRFWSCAV